MYVTNARKQRLYYEILNPQAKETLVLLNGLTQTTVSWVLMSSYFKDFKLVLLDFIFQGKSDKDGDWQNFDAHAEDVLMVLKNEGIEKAFIAG